jgi:hypothetical protein
MSQCFCKAARDAVAPRDHAAAPPDVPLSTGRSLVGELDGRIVECPPHR